MSLDLFIHPPLINLEDRELCYFPNNELLWIRNILRDLGIEYATPMNLYCDNKAAIQIAQNAVQHDRTKHVEVDCHFIKENLDEKIIQFPFIQSES